MPRVKCTPEEEVANLNRRATETANKTMKRSIEIALKNKPSIIKPLYDKMQSLGVSESNLSVREDMPLSFTATAHLQRSSTKQEVALGTFSKTEDGLSPDYTCLLYTSPSPRDRG